MAELFEILVAAISGCFFPGLVIVLTVLSAVRSHQKNAAQREQRARQTAVQTVPRAMTPAPVRAAAQPAAPAPASGQVPGQIHFSSVLPDRKPPRATPPQGSLKAETTEGMELHPAGFHGERPGAQLEKVDLEALRAQENEHTAGNLNWMASETGTEETARARSAAQPMVTAQQLRNAFVMQEILDAPVSRRQRVRRSYGR